MIEGLMGILLTVIACIAVIGFIKYLAESIVESVNYMTPQHNEWEQLREAYQSKPSTSGNGSDPKEAR